jgi:hypothetical protein
MKTMQYLVRINRDADSDWGASVPDLPGCVAPEKRSTAPCAASSERSNFMSEVFAKTVCRFRAPAIAL